MRWIPLVLLLSCVPHQTVRYSPRLIRNWMSDCRSTAYQSHWCACALLRMQGAGVPESRIFDQIKTKKNAPDLQKLVEDCPN